MDLTQADFPLLHLRRSDFQSIAVSQHERLRLLRTDHRAVQSALDLDHPQRLILPYMQAMLAGLLFRAPPADVLLLGLGGGDLVRFLHHYLPQAHLAAVEIDAAVIEVCRDWFALPQSGRVTVHHDDAAHFIATGRGRHDLLLVDIYQGAAVPALVLGKDFYRCCHARLTDEGMLVMNLLTDNAETVKSILWLLRRQFDCATLCLTVPGHINLIVFAFRQRPTRLTLPALAARAAQLGEQFEFDFSGWAQQLFSTNPTEGGELIF